MPGIVVTVTFLLGGSQPKPPGGGWGGMVTIPSAGGPGRMTVHACLEYVQPINGESQ